VKLQSILSPETEYDHEVMRLALLRGSSANVMLREGKVCSLDRDLHFVRA
jgi:hypothetical protein